MQVNTTTRLRPTTFLVPPSCRSHSACLGSAVTPIRKAGRGQAGDAREQRVLVSDSKCALYISPSQEHRLANNMYISRCYLPVSSEVRRSYIQCSAQHKRTRLDSVQWLFRSNIPRKKHLTLPADVQKRNFFGMGEIIGVITNPAETVRSLTESKRLLEEARREIEENRERAQIRPKHTFSRLPGFFARRAEVTAIERALEGDPSFTVLFGASSVGKTALLREVLSRDKFHVMHFDLRIAGFADLESLYASLSVQMELYFETISTTLEGYEEFKKEAWAFKHDRMSVERRLGLAEGGAPIPSAKVKTSDVARLMEMFQSSLLKYWEFQPKLDTKKSTDDHKALERKDSLDSSSSRSKRRWVFRHGNHSKDKSSQATMVNSEKTEEKRELPRKKIPVFFFDEAHKLPALIKSTETMKCLLDSMLVLTKQDRLCHVIHATSDPFYQTWLRQLNVMQHCKIITIGDCSKSETRAYFYERILPSVPEDLRHNLDFEVLYSAFGGKLAHWSDYITDYINSGGHLTIKESSHFLQAHALLNLHLIYSSQSQSSGTAVDDDDATDRASANGVDSLHPRLGAASFRIYSPISHPHGPGGSASMAQNIRQDEQDAMNAPGVDFSAMELLRVMSRLSQPGVQSIPYFVLCREMGVRAVDGMVKGRVLDLRWTDAVKPEYRSPTRHGGGRRVGPHQNEHDFLSGPTLRGAGSEDGHMSPIPDNEVDAVAQATAAEYHMNNDPAQGLPLDQDSPIDLQDEEERDPVVGPRLVPITPIMRYAMRAVVEEYEDAQSVSEYASLSDVEEY